MKLLAALVFSSILLNICSCQDVVQRSNDNTTLYERIKSYIVSNITYMSNKLDEVPTKKILYYNVPLQSIEFSDTLLIEDINIELTNEKQEKIILKTIEVDGFSNATLARFEIDKDRQQVSFQAEYGDIKVKFHYTVSNISDTVFSGFGRFGLGGIVNYTEDDQNLIHLKHWNSTCSKTIIYRPRIETNRIHNLTTEKNIKKLWEEVQKQIAYKIPDQIYTLIIESVLEATSQNSIAAKERSYMSDGLHYIIAHVCSLIKPGEALEVENGNVDKDTETEDQITISSIKLMGIQNYYLNSSNVSIYDGYIGANFNIIIPNVNTTVNFTIYDDDDNNRQVIANYSIKQIVLELFVRKNVNVTGIELQRGVFGVLELEPYLNQGQHNETEMALIRNSTDLLYAPITNIIEHFFEHDLRLVRLEGAPHYYQRLTKKESSFDQTKHYYEIEVDTVFIYNKDA